VTVFSAPNYCGWYGNRGAIMLVEDSGDFSYRQFDEVPNLPFVLPKHLNAFSYSMPILIEKVANLFSNFFNLALDQETEAELVQLTASRTLLRSKILALGAVNKNLHATNEKNELLIKLKGLFGGNLPSEANSLTCESLQKLVAEYGKARELDAQSEIHPSLKTRGKCQTDIEETNEEIFWKGISRKTGLTPRDKSMGER